MNNATQTATQQAPQPVPAALALFASGEKPFETFGQKTHKWGTYLSVDWGLNYLTGIGFAAWGKYTKTGQQYWKQPVTAAATYVAAKWFRISPAGLGKSVENIVAFFSVIAGGMFTIPPLMVLENKHNRTAITKWIDKKHYGKDVVENDPRFAEAYAAVENREKQGFWTGLASRLASLAPLLAMVMLDKPRDFTQPYFDAVAKGSSKVYSAVGLTKERLFKNYSPRQRGEEWRWLHANSAIDFGLEPWYALLHMITYRGFANWFGSKRKHATLPAPATPASQSLPAQTKLEEQVSGPEHPIGHASAVHPAAHPDNTITHAQHETALKSHAAAQAI